MRFRKRPVEIEAWPYVPGYQQPGWLREAINKDRVQFSCEGGPGYHIKTLEGTMVAFPGDWIIQGVKGELYPCKPDIFAMTYEPIADADARAGEGKS